MGRQTLAPTLGLKGWLESAPARCTGPANGRGIG
jgi:hypothetical protein